MFYSILFLILRPFLADVSDHILHIFCVFMFCQQFVLQPHFTIFVPSVTALFTFHLTLKLLSHGKCSSVSQRRWIFNANGHRVENGNDWRLRKGVMDGYYWRAPDRSYKSTTSEGGRQKNDAFRDPRWETSSTERRTKLSEDVLHVNMILNGGLMVVRLKKDGGQEGLNKLPTQTFRFWNVSH